MVEHCLSADAHSKLIGVCLIVAASFMSPVGRTHQKGSYLRSVSNLLAHLKVPVYTASCLCQQACNASLLHTAACSTGRQDEALCPPLTNSYKVNHCISACIVYLCSACSEQIANCSGGALSVSWCTQQVDRWLRHRCSLLYVSCSWNIVQRAAAYVCWQAVNFLEKSDHCRSYCLQQQACNASLASYRSL